MKKRGSIKGHRAQLDISFGMIFSIIIIIALLGTALYAIKYFVNLSRCTDVGLFYNDLQIEINKAYESPLYSGTFSGKLPNGIDYVCYGNLSSSSSVYKEQYDLLRRYKNTGKNLFLYPVQKACDNSLASYQLLHVYDSSFFCVPVLNEKVEIKLSKESEDSFVHISK